VFASHLPAGFTLIEVLVALTITSVMLAATALTLGTLFRSERNIRNELEHAQMVSRLAAHMRRDAHEASSAVIEDGILRFASPSGLVEYRREPRRIVRVALRDNTQQHLEVFPWAEGATSTWEISAGLPAMVQVTIGWPDGMASTVRGPTQDILAVIGLHGSTSP